MKKTFFERERERVSERKRTRKRRSLYLEGQVRGKSTTRVFIILQHQAAPKAPAYPVFSVPGQSLFLTGELSRSKFRDGAIKKKFPAIGLVLSVLFYSTAVMAC